VDAVLFVGSDREPSPRLAAATAAGKPIVVLDQETRAQLPGASYLAVANKEGGSLAARHLLGLGHTEVGVLAGPRDNPTSRDRLRGFRDTMRSRGIRLGATRVKHTEFDFASGHQEAVKLLGTESVTALFCANDLIALGALKAAGQANIDVPAELSIIGFDDIFVSELVHPPLTTIRQPIHMLGEAAVELAVQLIERGTDEAPVHRQLPLELVVRESTTRAPSPAAS
jgi:LacI family transcriptional regulator